MRGARVRLELLRFACLIVSQLGSISTLCLIPTVHSFSSLRVQRNTHGVLANPDLSQAMAPSKKKRTHAVFCISSAHRLASTSKPRFVEECGRVKLNEICSKGKSSLRQKDVFNDGPYIVYGASGVIGTTSDYQNEIPYVAIVKDGAGVGRANACEPMTSVLGTMQALIPNPNVERDYLLHLVRSLRLGEGFSGSTIPHIYFKDYGRIEVPLPPLGAQKRIVSQLGLVEAQITQAEAQIEQLDRLVKSRFVEMFEESDRYNGSVYRLADIGEIASGITKGRKARDKELFETPYLSTANVQAGRLDLSVIKTIDATMPEIEKFRLAEGDVLMTEGGDPDKVGRGAVAHNLPKNCIHQNHVFRVRLNRVILYPEYFEMFLQSPGCREYFFRASKQTTGIATINKTQLRNMQVLVPPIKAQEEFLAFASQVDKSRFVRDHEMNFR